MKKTYKVIAVLTVFLMAVCMFTNVFAAEEGTSTTGSYIGVDAVMQQSQNADSSQADAAMTKLGGTIIRYVTNAGIILSVVMVAVLGIKYMLGSTEEKSEYKKSMMPLLVGAVLVFGASTISKIIIGLVGSFGA